MTMSEKEAALLAMLQNERQRWNELREYARQFGDPALIDAMNQASGRYAERSRTAHIGPSSDPPDSTTLGQR